MCVHASLVQAISPFRTFFSYFQFFVFVFHFSFLSFVVQSINGSVRVSFFAGLIFHLDCFALAVFHSRFLFCCIYFVCVDIILKCIIWTVYALSRIVTNSSARYLALFFTLNLSCSQLSSSVSVCIHTFIHIYILFFRVFFCWLGKTQTHIRSLDSKISY